MNRLALATSTLALALALAGCALAGAGRGRPPPEQTVSANAIPFDLAACAVRPLTLAPVSEEAVEGALLSLGPAFAECFVDGRAFDGAPLAARVRLTVGPEVTPEVLGTGVSPSGVACLTAAAAKLPFAPLEAGARAVSAEVAVGPWSKPVALGADAPSDVAGLVRLAQPSLCGCYQPLMDTPPPQLVAHLTLSLRQAPEVAVEPEPAGPLATCLAQRLRALPLPATQLRLAVPLLLENAYAPGPAPDAPPARQFLQVGRIADQRAADVTVAIGGWSSASAAYGALAAKSKPWRMDKARLEELKAKCAALVAADDAWLGSLAALVAAYQASLELAQAEATKDAAWAPTVEQATSRLGLAVAEVSRMEGQRKADQAACPKGK